MPPITWQDIMEAVARGWCADANASKEMDVVLAEAITAEVARLFDITDYREGAA